MNVQLYTEHDAGGRFLEAFFKAIKTPTTKSNQHHKTLKASWFNTTLGQILVIADDSGLYLLEFVDKDGLEQEIERLKLRTNAVIIPGITAPITSIKLELASYFDGTLKQFKTPLYLLGSPFQNLVWEELGRTPYGQTRSYAAQAKAIKNPTAYRAVANANGVNQLVIVVPCHRIINSNGGLGGYSSGYARKQWLLAHEKRHA